MSAYSREHERDADRIGALLMNRAGYDVSEASKVWANLMLEIKASPSGGKDRNPLFASHPASEERQQALSELATTYPGGASKEEPWQKNCAPYLREWLRDEVKRGQHEESIALLTRAMARSIGRCEYLYARGEIYRLRAGAGDLDHSIEDFRGAAALGGEPPETHRALGMIYRARKLSSDARASFERYLELAPHAPDVLMIRNYLEELSV
jgi:predicted Zn-dependent protease